MQFIQQGTISDITDIIDILAQSPKTLLYFYPKNDTPWCTREAQDFTTHTTAFKKLDIQIIWVSKDRADSHCSFISKYDLSPSYISDPDLILHKKYKAYGEKNNYGKMVTGVIRSTILFDNEWNILDSRHNIKATGHVERLLKRLSI